MPLIFRNKSFVCYQTLLVEDGLSVGALMGTFMFSLEPMASGETGEEAAFNTAVEDHFMYSVKASGLLTFKGAVTLL